MLRWLQIPHLRPAEYKRSRLSRNRRTVNRPYGGVLSGTAVRERSAYSDIGLVFSDGISPKLSCMESYADLYYLAGSSVPSWWKSRRL